MAWLVVVPYVWTQPRYAVVVAVFAVCMFDSIVVEAAARDDLPVTVNAPTTVEDACDTRPATCVVRPVSVDAPVTLKVPPVEMLVEIVEDAFTAVTMNSTETNTAAITTHPSFLNIEIPLINIMNSLIN